MPDLENQEWYVRVRKVYSSAAVIVHHHQAALSYRTSPNVEPYTRANLPVRTRRVVAGLQAGSLPLQVELGRYTSPKTPIEDHICKLCNKGVEDQEHFLATLLFRPS